MIENDSEAQFMLNTLKCSFGGTIRGFNSIVSGLQQTLSITNTLNENHYATIRSDVLYPQGGAFTAMQYADGKSAAVASPGRSFVMGFPFECIADATQRATIMRGIMAFLIQ